MTRSRAVLAPLPAVLLALALPLPAWAQGGDWPQWLGPHRDGRYDGPALGAAASQAGR